jgi:hypothetical protein
VSNLDSTQRWVQHVITDLDGVAAGVATAPGATAVWAEEVVRGNTRLGAHDRLALYSRTYQRRLTGCLRESYPGLAHALGEELFDDFALEYLRTKPSRSYTLAALGADWPEHLDATRPDRYLPVHEREGWPDFLVDLARLERTFFEVYDAPGVEGQRLPTAAALPPADLDAAWHGATITPVACLRLVQAHFPVGAYLVAVRRGEKPPLPQRGPVFEAVSRRDYVVTITELDARGHALLVRLLAGVPVDSAARAAGVPTRAAATLVRGWADHHLIAAVEVPRPDRPVIDATRGAV